MASISWASFVNLTVDGQRALDLSSSSTDGQHHFAGLIFVNFTVDGQRPPDLPQPHCSIASAHLLVFPIRAVPLNMVCTLSRGLVVPASSRSRDFAGLSFRATKNMIRSLGLVSLRYPKIRYALSVSFMPRRAKRDTRYPKIRYRTRSLFLLCLVVRSVTH